MSGVCFTRTRIFILDSFLRYFFAILYKIENLLSRKNIFSAGEIGLKYARKATGRGVIIISAVAGFKEFYNYLFVFLFN
ncbi:MAG TPA: hypothetical protein DC017_16590 [Candidatus Wallbacteria bacterium]|nr:hypothetical protein [Candidatus Wallbacteria bacterium]